MTGAKVLHGFIFISGGLYRRSVAGSAAFARNDSVVSTRMQLGERVSEVNE